MALTFRAQVTLRWQRDLALRRSVKIVCNRAVEAATLAELRRAYADASAIAELVDFVEQVHNIEASTSIHRKTADTNTATKARAAGQLFIACEFLAAGWIPQLFF
jgi:hypothetical protein